MPHPHGNIRFSFVATNGLPWTIPSTAPNSPKNAVCASLKNWDQASSNLDSVFIQTIGTAPNRKCVITYRNYPLRYCTNLKGKFQFVLHESSNVIDIHLFNIPSCVTSLNFNGYATMGVQNLAGTVATAVPGRNNTYWTATNESWRFTPVGMFYWSNALGDTIGLDSSLNYVPTKSEWIFANAWVCPDTLIRDSAFIIMECYDLNIDSFASHCMGDSTGMAVASCADTAFVGPYTWYWTDSLGDTIAIHNTTVPSDTLPNIPSGYYFCRAYDSLMIAASGETWVMEQDTAQALMFGVNLLCFEDSTGMVVAADTQNYTGVNWNGSYGYAWYDSLGTLLQTAALADSADTLFNLPAGTYTVIVDACIDKVGTVSIAQPNLLTATVSEADSATCANTCDGAAIAEILGGTAPYTALWSNAETGFSPSELCPGTDTVWITDSNGCVAFDTFLVFAPDSLLVQVSSDTLVCISNTVSLWVQAVGGAWSYAYSWLDDANSVIAQSNPFDVVVTTDTAFWATANDQNGCTGDTALVSIKVRPPLSVSLSGPDTICPADEALITATAPGGDSVYSYLWSDGKTNQSVLRSFAQPQWYALTVSDACGTPSIANNIWIQVGGYASIQAQIIATDDSICPGEVITLSAMATGGFGGPQSYDYAWSHTPQNTADVSASPLTSQSFTLTVTDQCLSAVGQANTVLWVDTSGAPKISVDNALLCNRNNFTLRVDNYQQGNHYRWTVNNNRDTIDRTEPTLRLFFPGPGCQQVGVEQTSAYGCVLETDTYCLFTLMVSPYAAFYTMPEYLTQSEQRVVLHDSSQMATAWAWYVNEKFVSDKRNPAISVPDTGYFKVMQVAYNELGCTDTALRYLEKFIEPQVYLPNAITPDGDGLNEVFRHFTTGVQSNDFQISIFDRWGILIFESTDPDFGWDGTDATGQRLPSGSYGYVMYYKDYRNRNGHKQGVVNVVR